MEATFSPVISPVGEPVATVVVTRDVTERRKAEAALKESEERFRAIAENVGTGLVITAPDDGTILYANPTAAALLAVPIDNVVGRKLVDFCANPKPQAPMSAAARHPGQLANREVQFVRPDGERRVVVISVRAIRYLDRNALISSLVDVTELRSTQEQVVQAAKLATLGEMATSIAHEINQPLNIIRMSAEAATELARDGAPLPDQVTTLLDRITSQIDRVAAITEHMTRFGRRATETTQTFSVGEIVINATGLFREQLRLRGIGLDVDLHESGQRVEGNAIQLEQVILNLLANARDAITDKPPADCAQLAEERITVRVEGCTAGTGISIIVQDTGGGICDGIRGRIFEPFFTTKDIGKGTGLGLAVSDTIVNEMGGTLTGQNVDGGARFTVTLPATDAGRDRA